MREISLRHDLLPRHQSVLRALEIIAMRYPADDWCLVGGMMVIIASRDAGGTVPRAELTKDADLLVDLCAQPGLLRVIANQLEVLGFEQPAPFGGEDFARCTFMNERGQIDLLGPDDAGEELLVINETSRTLAIPGGRRALQVAERVRLTYDELAFDVDLRVPLLPGAIVVKAAAALDPRTRDAAHHIQDVAHMLRILPDPIAARTGLTAADQEQIAELAPRLRESGDVAWRGMDQEGRLKAQTALELILDTSVS